MSSPWLQPIGALALAELSLILGPVALARVGPRAAAFLDGFVLASISALVGFHLLPEAMAELGVAALGLAVLGFSLPAVLHRLGRKASSFESALWVAVGTGLFVHAALDGAALSAVAAGGADGYSAVVLAVVLHRLPVGLFGWWTVRNAGGTAWAVLIIAGVGIATAVGFVVGGTIGSSLGGPTIAAVVALVAGSLLHVMVDHEPFRAAKSAGIESAGAALGLVTVGWSEWGHHGARLAPFFAQLFDLALHSSPALVAGLVGASLIRAARAKRSTSDAPFGARWRALAPIPGATADLGLAVLLYSVRLLGSYGAIVRLGAWLWTTAAIAGFGARPVKAEPDAASLPEPPPAAPAGFSRSLGRHLDAATGWIAAGWAAGAAILETGLGGLASDVPSGALVLLLALLAFPLRMDPLGVMPVTMALWSVGVSAGASIAFAVAGTTFSYGAFVAVRAQRDGYRARGMAATALLGAASAGWIIDLALSVAPPPPVPSEHSPFAMALAAALAVAMLTSAARQGPRRLLESLFESDAPASGGPRS